MNSKMRPQISPPNKSSSPPTDHKHQEKGDIYSNNQDKTKGLQFTDYHKRLTKDLMSPNAPRPVESKNKFANADAVKK